MFSKNPLKDDKSVIIEAVTDSSLRTTSEVKSIFRKEGASFGQPGSVAYQFESKGRINIKKNGKSLDEIFNLAAESGAEDLEEVGDNVVVFVSPLNLSKVRSKLQENGLNILDTEIVRKPFQTISIQDNEQREKIISFLQTLEDLDDVQKVYSNLA
jgi:transcriptional/translational regulatory protein YebC/TACO1